jgi:PKD repeat protein
VAFADDVTDIVITEVMYNPASGDKEEDFIELHNLSPTQTYNLQGFQFTSGVSFTFPNVSLGPQGYLVVCANQNRIRQLYGITNTAGDWDPLTTLDNGGERIKLVNAAVPPVEVEDFTYNDRNPWPILADGLGHSLERRNPAYDNDNPANWAASNIGSSWTKVTVTGLATSQRLYLYLLEAGTAYVDDLKLYPVGNPGDNRIVNGDFESATLAPWVATGTQSGSITTTEKALGGSRSLKIIATGAGASQTNSVYQDAIPITVNEQYTLEFSVFFTRPADSLVARLSGSTGDAQFYLEVRGGGGATPGRQNSVHTADIPPFIYPAAHDPATPIASSRVSLLAQVQDDNGVASVTAHWNTGSGEQSAAMFDDGSHGDGVAADGLYGIAIGSFPTGSVVRYWFTALDNAGQEGRFPFAGNPTPSLGFYNQPSGINPSFAPRSNSGLTSSKPAVYHLLIDPAQLAGSPPQLSGDPLTYRQATFIYNGEVFDNVRVRHRGQTSLGVPKKHWKFDFNKDHRFLTPFDNHPEIDNFNLQSGYGDKTFLREWLSYKAWMDVGLPGLEMWHVRFYVNGTYRGLYIHLETPNADWMQRTGLDAEGWLWKSYSDAKGGTGGFEIEESAGNPTAATAALGSFMSNMNTLTGQALVNYINLNMNVQSFTDFLAIHQLIHNCDHPAKNYLVYADEDAPAGSWTYLGWDMDLTHGRNFECAGGGVYNDTIRFDMFGDPKLLFGTSVRPKCDGPWNGVINAFLNKTTALRTAYYERTGQLLNQLYHPSVLHPIIDSMSAPLASEAEMNWNLNPPYGTRGTYGGHVNALKTWAQNRYNYISNALTSLGAPADLDGLACQRAGSDASLSWTNHGSYDAIRVFQNDVLHSTLAGSATSTSIALDMGVPLNTFRVASVAGGSERSGQSCSIIISTGGYTKVIDEDFSPPAPDAAIAVNCSAVQTNGVLQLTEPVGGQAGSAFFRAKFPDRDFIADFDFRMDEPSSPGADGLVFALSRAGDPTLCGPGGGALGYFTDDSNTATVFPGFAVVFDTWQNAGEPSHNWAGFYDAGASGAVRDAAVDVPEEFTGNGAFHARVTGKDGAFTLLLSNPGIGMAERQIFSHTMPDFASEDVFFGFTAGTGGAFARHIVDNFVLQINTGGSAVAGFTAASRSGPAPLSVAFSNTSTGATTYLWSFGDGKTSTQVSPTHVYTQPGTYSVSLTATGPGGSDTHTEASYISVSQGVHAEFVASPTLGKAPLLVTFTNQSTGGSTYLWTFGDGATSTAGNPTHTYQEGGQYTVVLTARGADGDEDTMTRAGYIQADGALDADFTGAPTQGLAPLSVQFADISSGGIVSGWLWDFGDGQTSQEQNPAHLYAQNGTYNVRLQAFGFASSSTEVKTAYIRVGSPTGVFSRGDANNDGRMDISDAIAILTYLFSGGVVLDCLDAADADDTGRLELTDAVRILGFLFQSGAAPAQPFPGKGADPTADNLSCQRS